jgi:uncharacterized Rmd1/YagE family protein
VFDHFVDKYKEACVIRQMTKTDWIQIILLSISIVISLVAPFLTNGVILIIGDRRNDSCIGLDYWKIQ